MTIEEKLKNMIILRYGSVKHFADTSGLPYQTVVSILKRGILKSGLQNVIDMCKVLNISVDSLAQGKIITLPQEDLPKEQQVNDLPDLMEAYIYHIQKTHDCTLDEEPLSVAEFEYFSKNIDMVFDQMRAKRIMAYVQAHKKWEKEKEDEKI